MLYLALVLFELYIALGLLQGYSFLSPRLSVCNRRFVSASVALSPNCFSTSLHTWLPALLDRRFVCWLVFSPSKRDTDRNALKLERRHDFNI